MTYYWLIKNKQKVIALALPYSLNLADRYQYSKLDLKWSVKIYEVLAKEASCAPTTIAYNVENELCNA